MFQQTTTFVICALRVNTCEVSVYTVRTFIKCTHVCAAQNDYELFTKLYIKPEIFPFHVLADEIAEPRPDMNIKVSAFTVSEKYINTWFYLLFHPVFA